MTAFNPSISIASPFPVEDMHLVFVWINNIRGSVAGDDIPGEIVPFMDRQLDRLQTTGLMTWAILRDGESGGYFEALPNFTQNPSGLSAEAVNVAECSIVFKKDFWHWNVTNPALNLCLQATFAEGAETAFFPVFDHCLWLQELLRSVGMRPIGATAPRLQDGAERPAEMYAITRLKWEKRNKEFIEEAAKVKKEETAEATV